MSDGDKPGAEKRKPGQSNDIRAGTPKKAREDNGEGTVATEEEIDEFFAIIKRMHVAVSYFKKTRGEGRDLKKIEALGWETTSVENNGVIGEVTRGKKNMDFDLNADPVTDQDPL